MSEYKEEYRYEEDEQEIHLRDYLMVVKKRKGVVLLLLFVAVALALVKAFTAEPQYTASSQVMIEKNTASRGLENQYYSYWDPGFLETQSELIRSVNVGRRVVDSLDLTGKYRSHFFGDEAEDDKSIVDSVKDAVRGMVSSFTSFATGSESVDSVGSEAGNTAGIEPEPMSEEDIVARQVSGGLRVSPVNDTKIVSISYSGNNPRMTQMVTDAVVQAYMDELLEIKLATSSYQLKWMTDKAEQEREKLERSERALQQFMRNNNLVTVEDKLTIYPQKLSEVGSQLSRAEAERKELGSLVAQIKAAGGDYDQLENISLFADNQVLKDARDAIYEASQKIEELSKKYGPKHPVMIKANNDLKVLREEKRFEIQRIVDATMNSYSLSELKEKNIKELLDETKNEVLDLNEKFMQYSILKREVDSNRLLYDTLQTNIKKENITEQTQSVNIWVIEKAQMPYFPSKPNKKRMVLLGLVLGLFGGIGLAFVLEYLDNTAKSERELEDKYGRSVLGSVIQMAPKEGNIESYITREPLSPVAESYRLIRSNLLFSSAEKPPGKLLVSSMTKGEGKTTTAVNIARVLMQDNKKVLIVDCDLRRPRVNKVFGFDNESGLTTYLTGNSEKIDIKSAPGEQLSVITSGPVPPNPSELLNSYKMQELLVELQKSYDFILIDSPPVLSVTDSLALSKLVDGTIVVIQYGKTTYDMLDAGIKKFNEINANVLGFVLNGMKKSDAASYSNYSGYYSKYE